jgi:F0F1-type ATP synthase assembly protein I
MARAAGGRHDDGLSKAVEFAATPVAMGLIGWLIDQAVGTGPLLLVIFACFGLVGTSASFYYRYQAETARQEEGKPWTRRTL